MRLPPLASIDIFAIRRLAPLYKNIRDRVVQSARSVVKDLSPQDIKGLHAGSLKLYDAHMLSLVAKTIKPKRILEIGSFIGLSSSWLLAAAPEAHLTSVDPGIPHRCIDDTRRVFRRATAPDAGRLRCIDAFFNDGSFRSGAMTEHPRIDRWQPNVDETFDLIFIDAGHLYTEVAHDFRLARQHLAVGGVIAFHDAISWPGVQKLVGEIGATVHKPPRGILSLLYRVFGIRLGIDGIATWSAKKIAG